jgi:serine phosphatase RsbU (regulator of sigma subunit)
VEKIIAECGATSADCVVDSLFKAAAEHSAGVETFDDQTVVAIKVKGTAAHGASRKK